MENKRWVELMEYEDLNLSADEIAEGWHFCSEWDGLLVGPGMMELSCCHCLPEHHPAFKVKVSHGYQIIDGDIL